MKSPATDPNFSGIETQGFGREVDASKVKLLSRVKGQVSINVADRAFNSGDFVSGEVAVRVRRPIVDGVLVLNLRCDETAQTWDGQRRQHLEKTELFCWAALDEHNVSVESRRRFPFVFQVPRSHDGHAVDSMPGWGRAGGLIMKANEAWDSTVTWSLDARLHIAGLDLHDTSPITIFVR